jgi:hypothetical protein
VHRQFLGVVRRPIEWRYPSSVPGPGESAKPAPKEQLYRLPDEVTPEEIAAFDEDDAVDPEAVLRWLETGEADPWRESSG